MQIPEHIKEIVLRLEGDGFEAFLVGGCVRDALLSRRCFDFDITTSALPGEVKAALAPIKTTDTGIAHGTVTAILPEGNAEITTFRGEGLYSDRRHPDSVCFSRNLSDDLKRRDFTINALAYNEKSGLVDLFGGKEDLENKILRTVGNADERFSEDALRILRALRFASCLKFSIEEKTAAAIRKNFHLLSFVSKERIYSELTRLICGENAGAIIYNFFEVFNFILEISQPQEFYKKASITISNLPPVHSLRLTALFSDLGCNEAVRVLSALKSDTQTRLDICNFINNFSTDLRDRAALKRLMSELGPDNAKKLIGLKCAAGHITEDRAQSLICTIEEIIKNGECFSLTQLKISGNDLISLGLRGKEIGNTLATLLNKVISEEIENNREKLKYAAENIKTKGSLN